MVTAAGSRYRRRLEHHLEKEVGGDVRLVSATDLSRGGLRNVSMSQASGPLVCQWDDDDLNHPQRLTAQIDAMRRVGARASFLYEHLQLFQRGRRLCWCNWERSPFSTGHPGTLVAYKDAVPRYDPALARGEDAAAQQEMRRAAVPTVAFAGLGHLFACVCRGDDAYDDDHLLVARRYGMEGATIRERIGTIRSALASYPLEPPLQVVDHMGRTVLLWSRRDPRRLSLVPHDACAATWISGAPPGSKATVAL